MLEDKIYQDYVCAVKSRDRFKIGFLSFLRAEFKNRAIDLKKDKLDDNETMKIIEKQKKRLEDSRENIVKSGREDLLENLEKELQILTGYLPQQLDEKEIARIIEETISETNASTLKDMGKIMKEIMPKVSGKTDTKKVSELIKLKLSSL